MEPVKILTHSQMEMINNAAEKILEKTGMKIESFEALDFMEKFGCIVDRQSCIAKIPRELTQKVVAKMRKDYSSSDRPERMPVRFSHVRFRKACHQVHKDFTVSAGGFCSFIYDFDGNRRPANTDDVLCSINMVNNFEHIDYMGLPVADQTIAANHRPVVMAGELVKYTKKIGGVETFCKEDVYFIHEIAQIAAGSSEEFRKHPALVGYAEVRSPLCFDENMVDIFMAYIKLGVPQTVDTMPCGGTTAPVTAAGILALGVAETIAPMVLAYAIRDDAIVSMDINCSYADMSSGLFKYSGADRLNLLMARVQLLSEYYGCPVGVHGGKTDSCFYSEQAGAEKMSSILLAVLAGAVGIGTVGAIENAVTFSPVQLVIDNEIVSYVKRAIREPVEISEETLSVDLIDSVGPSGNFINEMHTAEHFKNEVFRSPLFLTQAWEHARSNPSQYDTVAKAMTIARDLWRKPSRPVLSKNQIGEIDKVIERALKK